MNLDSRTKALVVLGSAVAGGCGPCLENGLNMALEQGVAPAEIEAALEIGRMVRQAGAEAILELAREGLAGWSAGSAPAPRPCACGAHAPHAAPTL